MHGRPLRCCPARRFLRGAALREGVGLLKSFSGGCSVCTEPWSDVGAENHDSGGPCITGRGVTGVPLPGMHKFLVVSVESD